MDAFVDENENIITTYVNHRKISRKLVLEQVSNTLFNCIQYLKDPVVSELYQQLKFTRNRVAGNPKIDNIISNVCSCFTNLSETEIVQLIMEWGREDKLSLLKFMVIGSYPDSPVKPELKERVEEIFDMYTRSRQQFHAKPTSEKKVSFMKPK